MVMENMYNRSAIVKWQFALGKEHGFVVLYCEKGLDRYLTINNLRFNFNLLSKYSSEDAPRTTSHRMFSITGDLDDAPNPAFSSGKIIP